MGDQTTAELQPAVWRQTAPEASCCLLPSAHLPGDLPPVNLLSRLFAPFSDSSSGEGVCPGRGAASQ